MPRPDPPAAPRPSLPPDAAAAQRLLLARLLRGIREQGGLSQSDVAARMARPQSFVSKYESGERRLDLVALRQVCRALGAELPEVARRFDEACAKAGDDTARAPRRPSRG